MTDAEAVVVPLDPVMRYEIGAKYLLRKMKKAAAWEDDSPRICEGEYIPSHQVVLFNLLNAVPLSTEQ